MSDDRCISDQSNCNLEKMAITAGNIGIDVLVGNMAGAITQSVSLAVTTVEEVSLLVDRDDAITAIEAKIEHLTDEQIDDELEKLR